MIRYGQYCPVARAAEIVADRWTPLILRELLADIRHFNDLDRGLPGISRGLLAERLRQLERTGVIERRPVAGGRGTEYVLTEAGREIQRIIDVLGEWGARWAFGEPRPEELDPVILLWWMKRRVHVERLPARQVVIQIDFRGRHDGSYWLVMEQADVSVCLRDPGFEVDVLVCADIAAFYSVWLGRIGLATALRDETVRLDGLPALVRAFPRWFAWSPMAEAVRSASGASRRRRPGGRRGAGATRHPSPRRAASARRAAPAP